MVPLDEEDVEEDDEEDENPEEEVAVKEEAGDAWDAEDGGPVRC